MLTCPYCRSGRLEVQGGPDPDPFNKNTRPYRTVCLDCGRTLPGGEAPEPELSSADPLEVLRRPPMLIPQVVIDMTAQACNTVRQARTVLPYRDGSYSLSELDYPLGRYGSVRIDGKSLILDGETCPLTPAHYKTERHYTAYDYIGMGWPETVSITVYLEYVRNPANTWEEVKN